MSGSDFPPAKTKMVVCKRANLLGGGVAVLIGLVFIALHISEPAVSERAKHARHATFVLGVIVLGTGVALMAFTRVVQIQRRGSAVKLRRGWMVVGGYSLFWPHEFDVVEVRKRVPRFGGYLGMTSTIVWSVMLVDAESSLAADVSDFQAREPADALCTQILTAVRETMD